MRSAICYLGLGLWMVTLAGAQFNCGRQPPCAHCFQNTAPSVEQLSPATFTMSPTTNNSEFKWFVAPPAAGAEDATIMFVYFSAGIMTASQIIEHVCDTSDCQIMTFAKPWGVLDAVIDGTVRGKWQCPDETCSGTINVQIGFLYQASGAQPVKIYAGIFDLSNTTISAYQCPVQLVQSTCTPGATSATTSAPTPENPAPNPVPGAACAGKCAQNTNTAQSSLQWRDPSGITLFSIQSCPENGSNLVCWFVFLPDAVRNATSLSVYFSEGTIKLPEPSTGTTVDCVATFDFSKNGFVQAVTGSLLCPGGPGTIRVQIGLTTQASGVQPMTVYAGSVDLSTFVAGQCQCPAFNQAGQCTQSKQAFVSTIAEDTGGTHSNGQCTATLSLPAIIGIVAGSNLAIVVFAAAIYGYCRHRQSKATAGALEHLTGAAELPTKDKAMQQGQSHIKGHVEHGHDSNPTKKHHKKKANPNMNHSVPIVVGKHADSTPSKKTAFHDRGGNDEIRKE